MSNFINGTYVYIVCADFGFYMEPDVEIIKVFLYYKCAKKFVDSMNYKYSIRRYSEPYYIIKKRVVLNE